jgi:hypothetical protein
MRDLSGIVDGKEIIILIEDDWKPCHIYVRIVEHNIVRLDDTFPNAKMLSAFLSDELAYGPACEFLRSHGVPRESVLWDLNHSGYPKDLWE